MSWEGQCTSQTWPRMAEIYKDFLRRFEVANDKMEREGYETPSEQAKVQMVMKAIEKGHNSICLEVQMQQRNGMINEVDHAVRLIYQRLSKIRDALTITGEPVTRKYSSPTETPRGDQKRERHENIPSKVERFVPRRSFGGQNHGFNNERVTKPYAKPGDRYGLAAASSPQPQQQPKLSVEEYRKLIARCDKANLCRYYGMGKMCRRGVTCKYRHEKLKGL